MRQIFQPALYPESKLREIFRQNFGEEELRSQPSEVSGVCAVGFEANPEIAPYLKDIERVFNAKGWKAFFIAPAAVADKNAEMNLTVDEKEISTGSSIVDRTTERHGHQWHTTTIPAFDFSEFMDREIVKRRRGKNGIEHVFAKMDIEGAEFLVIPKLLQGQGLCQGRGIDSMTIEWHDAAHRYNHIGLAPEGCHACDKPAIDKLLSRHNTCEHPEMMDVDDETYDRTNEPPLQLDSREIRAPIMLEELRKFAKIRAAIHAR